MDKKTRQSGYIGLILLLIGVAATLFAFQKMYSTPQKPETSNTSVTQTPQYGSLLGDIGAAKAVVNQTEQKETQTNKVLNSLK